MGSTSGHTFTPDDLALALRHEGPLPARAYLDPQVLAHEREALLARSWVCVGREQELQRPGERLVAPLTDAGVVVVRGHDLQLRAFHNVCQHRGACLVDDTPARSAQLVCPYHGWTYELDGRRRSPPTRSDLDALTPLPLSEHAGLIFVSLRDPWQPAASAWDGLDAALGRWPLRRLHLGRRVAHEARANWKLLAENFLESHHFPKIHPELERLTPTASATTLSPRGAWFGGTMDLREGVETVASDGALGGRAAIAPGERRVHDFLLFPGCMLSVQPDYLLVYRLWPRAVDLTRIVSEIWFHPGAASDASFDPTPVFSLWDRINAQDRAICESQQRGLASPGYRGGSYLAVEESLQRFAAMVARGYLEKCPWGEGALSGSRP